MLKDEEYEKLVIELSENIQVIQHKGLDITIKRIPDIKEQGDFDPRVLKVVQGQGKTEFEIGENPSIEDIRKKMGWPNIDVTKTQIVTQEKVIVGKYGSIPVKIYSPISDEFMPAIVFFHGGGFFGGSLECVENPCKALAEKAGAVVISVDYKLAPENPFPTGFEDCFNVVEWVYNQGKSINVNSNQIGVSGDSAGGNLAAVCSLKDRDLGTGMIKFQALIYPVVNISGDGTEDYKWDFKEYTINKNHEIVQNAVEALGKNGDFLPNIYLQGKTDKKNPYVSPLFAANLSGMPDTLIIVAEYDFLRLEGEAYARKLKGFSVNAKIIRYNGMDHAFMDKIGLYPQAEDAMNEIAKSFNEAL